MYARAGLPQAPILHAFLRMVEKFHTAWYR
jgi:hypothetical protein